jgi:hypothetical protein
MQTARATAERRQPERSLTWPPPTLHLNTNQYKGDTATQSALPYGTHGTFEEDLDNYPEAHFLSPIQMYEYEDWADDSDSDGEEVEWDAGITDFALFDHDRRQAEQTNEPLPNKWSGLLSQQASALQRSVQRTRQDDDTRHLRRRPSELDLPSLTPDVSPELRDDLDVESYHGQEASRPSVPDYLTIIVSPPDDEESSAVEDSEDIPLSMYIARHQQRAKADRKLQRPGLRHSRTMSGRIHSWSRPSWNIYTLGEDSEAEDRAENEDSDQNDEMRGRR